jgi:archaellum component FlaG (FlaF/FlaG flagellin family)
VGSGTTAYIYNPSGAPWTYSSHSGVAGNQSAFTAGNPNAPAGTQVAFIQGTGTISQTVSLTAGTFAISFEAAQRGNFQSSSQTIEVLVDGTVVDTLTPGSTSYVLYTTNSFTVTAGTHTVSFVGLNPNGGDNTAFLDNASIATATSPPPSPPPSSNALSDPSFATPNVGTGFSAYQYNPAGAPWTYSTSSGVTGNGSAFTSGNPNAPLGTQVAFIQQTGTISQTATFTDGTFTISFEAAQRGNFQSSSQTIAVEVDGNVVGTFTPSGTNYALYTTNAFTMTAGTHTVSFVGLDPYGGDNTVFLDDARIAIAS